MRARVLAVVLVLAAGFGLGRLTDGGSPPEPEPVSKVRPAGDGPLGYATRVVNGVPLGYPRSAAGAAAAATNFSSVGLSQLLLDPPRYRAAIETLAAPAARQELLKQAEDALNALEDQFQILTKAAQGTPVVIRSVSVGYHVQTLDDAGARVRVWGSAVIAVQGSRTPPVQAWETRVVDLAWVGDDWRLLKVESLPVTAVPALLQTPTPSTPLPAELVEFQDYLPVPSVRPSPREPTPKR